MYDMRYSAESDSFPLSIETVDLGQFVKHEQFENQEISMFLNKYLIYT